MYQIRVDYTTGDSFGSEETYTILEMVWKSLEVAKENLKRIQEHYKCYRADSSYWGKSDLEGDDKMMYDMRKQRDWYVDNKHSYHYQLRLKTDDGADWQISPSWVGYFEHLNEARIIVNEDLSGMKISF